MGISRGEKNISAEKRQYFTRFSIIPMEKHGNRRKIQAKMVKISRPLSNQ